MYDNLHYVLVFIPDICAAAVVIVPLLVLMFRRSMGKAALYSLFALYLAAVATLVGLPNIRYIRFDLNVNLVPFRDMISDLRSSIPNVVLFVPLGFFLHWLWNRSLKAAVMEGICVSACIELMQIFTFRATDVNDLITNTLGTLLGFLLAKLLRVPSAKYPAKERFAVYGVVLAVMFFVQPFLASFV